jgi:uncharacterized protein (TIGR00730 family)
MRSKATSLPPVTDRIRVCVFCGSSDGADPRFLELAAALGRLLAERGIGLVYGGATIGLMGAVADGCNDAGGEVIGVIPGSLEEREIAHTGISELRIVGSMHERKSQMYELANGFIALPGGLGTLEEVFEAATWNHLSLHPHRKQIALLDAAGFWEPLDRFLDTTVEAGFVKPLARRYISLHNTIEGALDAALSVEEPR